MEFCLVSSVLDTFRDTLLEFLGIQFLCKQVGPGIHGKMGFNKRVIEGVRGEGYRVEM